MVEDYGFGPEHAVVVNTILETLPEFCIRNNITLSKEVQKNLAFWVVSSIPYGYTALGCPNAPYACACLGICHRWERINE